MQKTKKDISDFRKEDVYHRSLRFSAAIKKLTKTFPKSERYILVDQLDRASSSIPSNIAEGRGNIYFGKDRDRQNSALGSAAECQSLLDMAVMQDYLSHEEYKKHDADVQNIIGILKANIDELTAEIDEQ